MVFARCRVYNGIMKTLLALLIVLLLTSSVMAQDDDILICLRDDAEECPCIPDVPHTCPDDEPEEVEPVRVVTALPPRPPPQIRMPVFYGLRSLKPR